MRPQIIGKRKFTSGYLQAEIYDKIKTLRIPEAVSVRFFVDKNYRLVVSAAFYGADDQNEPEKI